MGQAHANAEEHLQARIDVGLRDQALVQRRLGIFGNEGGAVDIGSCVQNCFHSFFWSGGVVMRRVNILIRIAVAGDVAVKAPVVAGHRLEQPVIGTGGDTVDGVVAAHQGGNSAFLHTSLERAHV